MFDVCEHLLYMNILNEYTKNSEYIIQKLTFTGKECQKNIN